MKRCQCESPVWVPGNIYRCDKCKGLLPDVSEDMYNKFLDHLNEERRLKIDVHFIPCSCALTDPTEIQKPII